MNKKILAITICLSLILTSILSMNICYAGVIPEDVKIPSFEDVKIPSFKVVQASVTSITDEKVNAKLLTGKKINIKKENTLIIPGLEKKDKMLIIYSGDIKKINTDKCKIYLVGKLVTSLKSGKVKVIYGKVSDLDENSIKIKPLLLKASEYKYSEKTPALLDENLENDRNVLVVYLKKKTKRTALLITDKVTFETLETLETLLP